MVCARTYHYYFIVLHALNTSGSSIHGHQQIGFLKNVFFFLSSLVIINLYSYSRTGFALLHHVALVTAARALGSQRPG